MDVACPGERVQAGDSHVFPFEALQMSLNNLTHNFLPTCGSLDQSSIVFDEQPYTIRSKSLLNKRVL